VRNLDGNGIDDKVVAARFEEAVHAWPGVELSEQAFRDGLTRAFEGAAAQLEDLHTSDIYLALACLERQPKAIAALESLLLGAVRRSIERAAQDGSSVDDVVQTTIEKLVFGPAPAEPKLAQYTGRGSLVAWIRVVAVREALQSRRKSKRERIVDDVSLVAGTGTGSAATHELDLLRRRHADSFRGAVQEAIRRLASEQRAILRFHVLDHLTIDQLAPLLGVHRATAARRLEKARVDALHHTKAILRERHGLSDSEAKSLCLALVSEVDVSIGRALREASL
jgi:RNA polymerase sigma-70 factor (ECF subfamily)